VVIHSAITDDRMSAVLCK